MSIRRRAAAASSGSPCPRSSSGEAEDNQTLAGSKIALLTRNAVLREGLMAEIKAAGGDVVPFGYSGTFDYSLSRDADAVLVDAGLDGEAELPAWPYPEIRSIVLLTSAARGRLEQLRANGFTTYLVKPVRQASLIDRIRADAAALDRAAPLAAIAAVPAGETARRLKILLAEDNPVNALVSRELFKRRGHDVREVVSGEGAIEAALEETFDLILMDIHMPGLDGIEATKRIRRNEFMARQKRTPIVALTADVLETGRQACQDVGMDGFLSKPIDTAELDAMFAKLFPSETRPHEAAA